MQLIRVSVLTRILKTEVIESIPGKKLGVKTENVEFDPENLAASAEILFFYELFQNTCDTCENSDIASVCHTDYEQRCFDFH